MNLSRGAEGPNGWASSLKVRIFLGAFVSFSSVSTGRAAIESSWRLDKSFVGLFASSTLALAFPLTSEYL